MICLTRKSTFLTLPDDMKAEAARIKKEIRKLQTFCVRILQLSILLILLFHGNTLFQQSNKIGLYRINVCLTCDSVVNTVLNYDPAKHLMHWLKVIYILKYFLNIYSLYTQKVRSYCTCCIPLRQLILPCLNPWKPLRQKVSRSSSSLLFVTESYISDEAMLQNRHVIGFSGSLVDEIGSQLQT